MKDRKLIFTVILIVLALAIVVIEWQSRSAGPRAEQPEVTEVTEQMPFISAGLNKDGLPAIDDPIFVSIAQADSYLSDDKQGLSVTLEGQTRFYPYQILVWHEVVNDRIGDTSFVVTYCALCGSGIAYDRHVGKQVLDFGVSGLVWNANTLLYDRQTDSRWVQLLGRAVEGPLESEALTQIPAQVMTWSEWKRAFPNGKTLSRETGFVRDYTRNPYIGYEEQGRVMFPLDARDDRLHPKELVYGYVSPDGVTSAYPYQYLMEEGGIIDEVDGRRLELTYKNNQLEAIGEDITGTETETLLRPVYWHVWYAFFPETQLYDPIGDARRAEEVEEANEEV